MTGKSIRTMMGVGLIAMALAVTAAVALPEASLAQTGTGTQAAPTTVAPSATTTQESTVKVRGGHGFGKLGGANGEYLAEALGITADELTAAQEEAQTAAIDKALADGLITQSQADALKNGTGLGRGGRGMLGGLLRLGGSADIDTEALLADALGITTDELTAARTKAQDLALEAAVADGRITQEQADLMKARQAFNSYLATDGVYGGILDQAVQAGAITRAQADALLNAQQSRIGIDEVHGFGGFGGIGRGMRGHRGGGF